MLPACATTLLLLLYPLDAPGEPASPPPPEWQDDEPLPVASPEPLAVGLFATLSAGAYLEGSETSVLPRHRTAEDPARTGLDLQRLQLGFAGARGPLSARAFLALPHAHGLEVDEVALVLGLPTDGADRAWLRLEGGVLRSRLGHQNALHLVQQWMPRRPAMTSALLGPRGLVAPGVRAALEARPGSLHLGIDAELFSVDRESDATLAPQTFGGDGPETPTPVLTARARVPVGPLSAEASATYSFGRMYFPDRTQLCTIAGVTTPCPAARSHLYGGHVLLEGRPGGMLVRGVLEAFFRRVPAYDLSSGALYLELDAQPRPWLEAALRVDAVGVPADGTVLRKSQLFSASLAWTSPSARVRLSYQYDHKPQALKAPAPPAPPEVDGTALFLQAEVGLGTLAEHFTANHR